MRALLLALCLLAVSCGGGGTSPSPNPSNPFTFTITAAGVSPKEFTVAAGTRVLFVNSDARRHDVASDPHPEHDDEGCGGLNSVGVLNPGQSRETGNMITVRTCGFHDHDSPENAALKGRIIIR
jgi:plastocyanin